MVNKDYKLILAVFSYRCASKAFFWAATAGATLLCAIGLLAVIEALWVKDRLFVRVLVKE